MTKVDHNEIVSEIIKIVSMVTELSEGSVPTNKQLQLLGVDSVSIFLIEEQIEKKFDIKVPKFKLTIGSTIQNMADFVYDKLLTTTAS